MDEKVLNIFRDVFNNSELTVTEDTTAADVDEWDSFNHLNLIMEIEEQFSVSFTTEEIGKMTRVGDLLRMLENKSA